MPKLWGNHVYLWGRIGFFSPFVAVQTFQSPMGHSLRVAYRDDECDSWIRNWILYVDNHLFLVSFRSNVLLPQKDRQIVVFVVRYHLPREINQPNKDLGVLTEKCVNLWLISDEWLTPILWVLISIICRGIRYGSNVANHIMLFFLVELCCLLICYSKRSCSN